MSSTSLTSAISADTFLDLFIAQLQNQDPLEPMDTSEITAQLAQLASVGSLSSLDSQFEAMLQLEQLNTAKDLIGCSVTYLDSNTGEQVTGTVENAAVQNSQVGVKINGNFVSLTSITSINGGQS